MKMPRKKKAGNLIRLGVRVVYLQITNGLVCLALVFSCLFWSCPVHAESASLVPVPEVEAYFIQLLNNLRAQPAQVLAEMGYDLDSLIAQHPERRTILTQGLARFYLQETITAAARNHVTDMMARDYVNTVSPEGRTLKDRLVEEGYWPLVQGEIISVLTFQNFIPPDVAAEALFRQAIDSEIMGTGPPVLLNPDATDVGISCMAGRLTINGVLQNAYLLVVDTAANIVHQMELWLFHEINRFRRDPNRDLFTGYLEIATGSSNALILEPVPAIAWSPDLYDRCRTFVRKAAPPFAADIDPENPLANERYLGVVQSQYTVLIDTSMSLDQVAVSLLFGLIQREAQRLLAGDPPVVLHPSMTQTALTIDVQLAENGGILLTVVVVAARPQTESSFVIGTIRCAPDPENPNSVCPTVAKILLIAPSDGALMSAATMDMAGGFHLAMPSGWINPFQPYFLVLVDAEGAEILRDSITLTGPHIFVELEIHGVQ